MSARGKGSTVDRGRRAGDRRGRSARGVASTGVRSVLRRVQGLCLVLALGGPGAGCGEEEPPPVQTARRFAQAVGAGDVEEVLTLVDAQTAARVQQAAERASDQVGGRRNVEPHEMLQVVDVDPRSLPGKAELVQGDDQRAEVRLTGADGTSHTLELIHENGAWRVHLPLPRGPMVEP